MVDKLFQQLTVADLLLSGQARTNSLRYVVEGTATSGAAGVAEAGLKPESTLGLTLTDEPVKKIATILPISEEMLEDAPAVQSYINGRLRLFVRIEEERQLLRGAGTNEIIGIMPTGNTRAINIYAGGTAAGNKAVQLFKAINGTRGSALVEPNFIVLSTVGLAGHPAADGHGRPVVRRRPVRRPVRRPAGARVGDREPGRVRGGDDLGQADGRHVRARRRDRPGGARPRPRRCGAEVGCPWRRRTRIAITSRETWSQSVPKNVWRSQSTGRPPLQK